MIDLDKFKVEENVDNTQLVVMVPQLVEECKRLRAVLKEIQDFGFINSGKGYSCATKAKKALE